MSRSKTYADAFWVRTVVLFLCLLLFWLPIIRRDSIVTVAPPTAGSSHALEALGKVAVSWLKIVGLGLGLAARILSHETATLSDLDPIANTKYRRGLQLWHVKCSKGLQRSDEEEITSSTDGAVWFGVLARDQWVVPRCICQVVCPLWSFVVFSTTGQRRCQHHGAVPGGR